MKTNQLKKTEWGHKRSSGQVGWRPTSAAIAGLRMQETIAAVHDPVYGVEVAVGFVRRRGRLAERSIAPDCVEAPV